MKIIVKDETIGGEIKNAFTMETEAKTATVKELIKLRIYEEVNKHNQTTPEFFNSLIQPTQAEMTLNGYKMKKNQKIDPEKQYYLALDAFIKNGYFLIINDKQVESLEQEIVIENDLELQFIKLTPLVGG